MVQSLLHQSFEPAEPGDRFELDLESVTPEGLRFRLPEGLLALGVSVNAVEDAEGRPLVVASSSLGPAIIAPEPPSGRPAAAWLESTSPGRFRLILEGFREELERSFEAAGALTERGVSIAHNPGDLELLRLGPAPPATLNDFEIALEAAELSTHSGFERLLCLPLLRDMDILEHQVRTAKTVLRRLRGRALLCDEVGLGKTIEAGLIVSELCMRGLARSVLVLVPPSLIEQWQGEMRRKFSLELTSHDDPVFREQGTAAWSRFDRVIASTHTAKREPHRSAILARKWDAIVVDEAHHLRNQSTQLWRFVSEIEKQFILLLTATPVQNNLEELFNLVTLLEPGLLSTSRQFQRRFVDKRDKLTPRNLDELHSLLGEVMVRNRRSTVGLQFTRRWARTERVVLSAGERKLYDDVSEFVRERLRGGEKKGSLGRMSLVSLQMAMGSSTRAAASTLSKVAESSSLSEEDRSAVARLAAAAREQTESAKAARLLQILAEYQDKVVVFTQFRATQDMLHEVLAMAGHDVAVFHGGLSRLEKEAAVDRFRGPSRILLATESGSEGRNLQFAHAVCNFDLPWNPMKIEQRIGRLSRIGQSSDIHVFNLVAAGTLEAAVLHLLDAKLSMFELVIGEIDMVLGNLDDDREFQDVVADLWKESSDSDEFSRRMEELGDRLLGAKRAYFEQRAHDDRIFQDRFTPEG